MIFQTTQFWDFNIGHAIELGVFGSAVLAYRLERGRDARDRADAREKIIQEQAIMHAENTRRLQGLAEFHKAQQLLNQKSDSQIAELGKQTAILTQMASGQERRLQMLEGRTA
jgi:hypothetical protein